jgi:very-short-patch-repair endonuclease
VEVDGVQHYADRDGRASPMRYAEMAAEDSRLLLAGYEVYRFGGQEIADRDRAAG